MDRRALIEEALRYTLWNRRKAAKLLRSLSLPWLPVRVLKQLVAYVGREPFMQGVSAYFRKHAFGNTDLRR